jgi:hypothetical protein
MLSRPLCPMQHPPHHRHPRSAMQAPPHTTIAWRTVTASRLQRRMSRLALHATSSSWSPCGASLPSQSLIISHTPSPKPFSAVELWEEKWSFTHCSLMCRADCFIPFSVTKSADSTRAQYSCRLDPMKYSCPPPRVSTAPPPTPHALLASDLVFLARSLDHFCYGRQQLVQYLGAGARKAVGVLGHHTEELKEVLQDVN